VRRGGNQAVGAADVRIAVLWVLAIVPQAFGFWLVAGDVAGLGAGDRPDFLLAALLTLGAATIAQLLVGYRLPLYEGPAAGYMASVLVVAAGGHGLAAMTGGMLVAGATVVLLGVLRFDRLLLRFLTPLTGMVFVLVVCVAVMPATLERAVASSDDAPAGTAAGWIAALATLGVALALSRRRGLRPYALLGALVAGTLAAAAIDGLPHADLGGGLAAPPLLPWGGPDLSLAVALPFVIGGAIVAFNTVAAIEIAGDATGRARAPGDQPRGLVVHGTAQMGGALIGNVLGTVGRLDSLPIASLLGTTRRAPLAIAAAIVLALAFLEPFLGLVAALPLSVSAALLAFMLGTMIVTTGLRLWPLGARARIVAACALVPALAWEPLQGSLSPAARLVANPMLLGVAIGVALEHLLVRRGPGGPTDPGPARPPSIRRRPAARAR
jgi:xanthine/uracil permease